MSEKSRLFLASLLLGFQHVLLVGAKDSVHIREGRRIRAH
jgi:hypothetical protein